MSDAEELFVVEVKNGVCVVAPTKAIDSLAWGAVDASADHIIRTMMENQTVRCVFDLSQVNYFGSIFISLMLRCWKHVGEHQGRFVLCGLTPNTIKPLEATKLHTIWTITPNLVSALAELSQD